ncbi:MAG: HPP family protein [Acidobacteriaceae bacterium]
MSRRDLLIAPVAEGLLILIVSIIGWASHQPLIFASLGPTAYELVETPKRPSARTYNVVVGHLIAVLAGFAALFIVRAWSAPPVSGHGVPLLRVWAAVIAAALTAFFTLLLRASQPASLSTTLLISLGLMQTAQDGFMIMAGVILITLVGEPIRILRLKRLSEIPPAQ